MRKLVFSIAQWLLGFYHGTVFIVPPEIADLIPMARKLADRQDRTAAEGTSGEWKRDRVYEQMLNTYADRTPKEIYTAILLARHDL